MADNIWEQQPGESDKAFNAFKLYYDMGSKRSHSKVASALGSRTSTYISEWAIKFQWRERVNALNADKLRDEIEIHKEQIKSLTEKQLQQVSGIRAILNIPFKVLTDRLKKDVEGKIRAIEDLEVLPTTELYDMVMSSGKMLDTIIKIERLLLGVPTDISKTETTITSDSELTIYGEKTAGDETATKQLTQFLNTVAGAKNGKPGHNGTLHHGR